MVGLAGMAVGRLVARLGTFYPGWFYFRVEVVAGPIVVVVERAELCVAPRLDHCHAAKAGKAQVFAPTNDGRSDDEGWLSFVEARRSLVDRPARW